MPIKVPDNLPAKEILYAENIFIMDETRAFHQDIRPLKIIILNLMPTKEVTETQLIRLLSNSPLQIELILLQTDTYQSKNTSEEHLANFYHTFSEIKSQKFDGMIITGAPVEHLEFEEVDYWDELKEIMEWSKKNVFSTLHICWAAQAGLYYHYNIPKYILPEKKFGVFKHYLRNSKAKLVQGFDQEFYAPHSRHTEIKEEDIINNSELEIIALSDLAGVYLVKNTDGSQIFVTGHSEYDALTLKAEYDRDLKRGANIQIPYNYFPDNDPGQAPVVRWRAHANLLFNNWLNYYVYQETPFNVEQIGDKTGNE